MYTISNRLKIFSIILIVLGALGVAVGFMTSHKTLDEVKTMLAEEHSAHGEGHAVAAESHGVSFMDHEEASRHNVED